MTELRVYSTVEGRVPFQEWLDSIKDEQTEARIEARLNRVRLGNLGDHHSVGQGVSELRMSFGSGYRVYFGQHGSDIVILLCGGDKSSQARDIRDAQTYWKDYKRRVT